MSENNEEVQDVVETTEEEEVETNEEGIEYSGRKIMCFVSKQMVPIEDTVEVEYKAGEAYRVARRYVHFDLPA